MQTLKVTFVGPPGSGKTLLSRILRDEAVHLGYNVKLTDTEESVDYGGEDARGLVEITCERNV